MYIYTIPTNGNEDVAMQNYINTIDTELTKTANHILDTQLSQLKRAEVALPGTHGGLGLQSLRIAVPAAFIGTVIAAMQMVKRMDPRLCDFILGTLHREDEMHINYAYRQLLEHHDWHDGSDERGKAPFDMPSSTKEAITIQQRQPRKNSSCPMHTQGLNGRCKWRYKDKSKTQVHAPNAQKPKCNTPDSCQPEARWHPDG